MDLDTLIPAAYEFFINKMRSNRKPEFLIERWYKALNVVVKIFEYGITKGEFSGEFNVNDIANFMLNFVEGLIITSVSVGINEI